MKKILVTGANGFIGTRACSFFLSRGYSVRAHSRLPVTAPLEPVAGSLSTPDEIDQALAGVQAVFHTAGLAHHRGVSEEDLERVNVRWTRELALGAERQRIPILYLSSSKIYGETGHFSEHSAPDPRDAYARAKVRAEDAVIGASDRFVILRPPPVYGAGSKGSFRTLASAVQKGWPLPFGSIRSLRSYVFIENLLSAVVELWQAGQPGIWNVSDDHDISLRDLCAELARVCGKPARAWPVPVSLVRLVLAARPGLYDKIAGEFTLDISRLKASGVRPWVDFKTGLSEVCAIPRA